MLDDNSQDSLERALEESATLRQQLQLSEVKRQVAEALSAERWQQLQKAEETIQKLEAALIERLHSMDEVTLKALENAGPEKQPPLTQRFVALPREVKKTPSRREQEMREVHAILDRFKAKHPDPVAVSQQAVDQIKTEIDKQVQ